MEWDEGEHSVVQGKLVNLCAGFTGFVYSGISIINKKLLKIKFKNFENFEKKFYPIIIKNYKTNLEFLNGFWSSVDNLKDINILNSKTGKKFKNIKKIKQKLKK